MPSCLVEGTCRCINFKAADLYLAMVAEASAHHVAASAICWGSFASSPLQAGLARLSQSDQQWHSVSPASRNVLLSGWSVQVSFAAATSDTLRNLMLQLESQLTEACCAELFRN